MQNERDVINIAREKYDRMQVPLLIYPVELFPRARPMSGARWRISPCRGSCRLSAFRPCLPHLAKDGPWAAELRQPAKNTCLGSQRAGAQPFVHGRSRDRRSPAHSRSLSGIREVIHYRRGGVRELYLRFVSSEASRLGVHDKQPNEELDPFPCISRSRCRGSFALLTYDRLRSSICT